MRIEQLYHLIEIAKTHSFTIAAQNLFISQPTISESIKKLEEELSITLLNYDTCIESWTTLMSFLNQEREKQIQSRLIFMFPERLITFMSLLL